MGQPGPMPRASPDLTISYGGGGRAPLYGPRGLSAWVREEILQRDTKGETLHGRSIEDSSRW